MGEVSAASSGTAGKKAPSRQRGVYQREGGHHEDDQNGCSGGSQLSVTLTMLEGPLWAPEALMAMTSKYQVPEERFSTT